MTMVIAPPPAAIAQLTDLIALFRNLDQAEKLVKDLQVAADEYNKAVSAASQERAEAEAALGKIAAAQDKADRATAANEKKLVELANAKAEVNLAKSAMVAEKAALDKERAQFDANAVELTTGLRARESAVAEAEAKLAAEREEVRLLKESLEAKLAILRA